MTLKIAFASCMDAERLADQPVWDAIRLEKPDVLLLLGDQIYMDFGLKSIAAVPEAKRCYDADRQKALEAFATDMHMRYRMQWGVALFRDLVNAIDRDKLFLTWDDHDFAWNNAYGLASEPSGGSEDPNAHTVNDDFKRIAWALRSQFNDKLTGAQRAAATYPGLPNLSALPAVSANAIPVANQEFPEAQLLMLDQRWSRSHRDAKSPQLLSAADLNLLQAQVARADAGLLVLAGSSPLKHHSNFGTHDAWWAPADRAKAPGGEDRAYPEYQALIKAAKRPMLYLGGDIHRNAFGGWVEPKDPDGLRPPIIQLLSSGAGLGKLFFHRFDQCYGIVDIDGTATDAKVNVALKCVEQNPRNTVNRLLEVKAGQWFGEYYDGECADLKLATDQDEAMVRAIGERPLPVLCYRKPNKEEFKNPGQPIDIDELDVRGYTDELPYFPGVRPSASLADLRDWPWALNVEATGTEVKLSRVRGQTGPDCARALHEQVFAEASSTGKSVVFFIHGFGKGFTGSLQQACALRDRFPEVLPVLFSWPTHSEGGLLAIIGGFKAAFVDASLCVKGLSGSLVDFCRVARAYAHVPAVVLARSLGAEALHQGASDNVMAETNALRRVIVSAPACDRSQAGWLSGFKTKVVVTINQNDERLKVAKWVGYGDLLGNQAAMAMRGVEFLDFTAVNGVGDAHDYLFRRTSDELSDLNDSLLSGDAIDFDGLSRSVEGLAVTRALP